MTTAVEANSLSSLTFLASNPPQYPRNPTHTRHEPLVLYIAKVPGSRDAFLTPLKPREKVVTAEDVTSCLYYLHVDHPEDAKLVEALRNTHLSQDSGLEPIAEPKPGNVIARKPVFPGRPSVDDARQSFDIPRKPPANPPAPGSVSPTRKPLPLTPRLDAEQQFNRLSPVRGAGPPNAPHHHRGSSDSQAMTRTENFYGDRSPGRIPAVHLHHASPPPYPDDAFGPPLTDMPSPAPRLSRSPARRGPPSPVGFGEPQDPFSAPSASVSLTLIRRDPASGAQWNVAKIRDVPTAAPNGAARQVGAPLHIEVLTPGYSKFLYEIDTRPPLTTRGSGLSAKSVDSAHSGSSNFQGNPQPGPKVFQRQVVMEGSSRFGGGYKHGRKGSKDVVPGYSEPPRPNGDYSGRASLDVPRSLNPGTTDSFSNPSVPDSQFGYSDNGREKSKPKFRGYVFTSPWNGRCEFVTAGAGTTLKCTHTIPVGVGAAAVPVPVTVSELRFNLPSGSRSPKKEDGKRTSIFSRPRHGRSKSSTAEMMRGPSPTFDDGTDRMDLSLGQEYAGGGFGGKQAKLGKLILEDEGLKMMDLLVAANLGLWWRAFERSEGKNKT